jgi:hypothetical protein
MMGALQLAGKLLPLDCGKDTASQPCHKVFENDVRRSLKCVRENSFSGNWCDEMRENLAPN